MREVPCPRSRSQMMWPPNPRLPRPIKLSRGCEYLWKVLFHIGVPSVRVPRNVMCWRTTVKPRPEHETGHAHGAGPVGFDWVASARGESPHQARVYTNISSGYAEPVSLTFASRSGVSRHGNVVIASL